MFTAKRKNEHKNTRRPFVLFAPKIIANTTI